jgi:hypothetical protein
MHIRTRIKWSGVLITLLFAGQGIMAQEKADALAAATAGIQLTVYNSNLAVVKERRNMTLPKGLGAIRFTDVATQIDATSVHFESLSDPEGTSVLEQNYEYDLVNPTKLLDKYIDAEVSLFTKDGGVYAGALLSQSEGRIVLRDSDGKLQVVTGGENLLRVELISLPEGLITRPTLVWETHSASGGEQLCQVTYMTGGINWKADYVMVVDDKDARVDVTGWVTLDNQSGATYKEAKLKLIAGDVNRVQEQPVRGMMMKAQPQVAELAFDAAGFEEKAFFEYHLYTLQRPTTIRQAQTKQVELLAAHDVPAKKVFIYNGSTNGKKVEVKMEFKNSKENNMGMALPKGKVRAFKADSDGSLEFLGEDLIDHTPKDEELRILLGNAFDIVGERTQTEQKQVTPRVNEQSWKIELRNHKTEPVTIKVVEPQWGDWKVTKSSNEYRKKDAQTLEFDLNVPADGTGEITYTVQTKF